jgi:shikimate kinase/3-dehydroquinate synthase
MPEADRTAIALIGFMGAGKTTAGRVIARELGLELRDTDELIEQGAGRPIATLFKEYGEQEFRAIEERVVLGALDRGGVVALGGGAIESERIRAALRGHLVVWCDVTPELAWERCAGSDRPLARDRDAFRRRYEARRPLYEEAARVILPAGVASAAPAAPWLGALRTLPDARGVWAEAASGSYPALVGAGVTGLFATDPGLAPGARLFAAADRAAATAAPDLVPAGVEEGRFDLDGGEPAKTMAAAESLLGELARAGVRRDDALVAFGGGVVGDLAGFCAAVYQRGIPVVQVPTTLVAQVDSALGGKTGVDLPEAKNYVGAYHQPAAVLADPAALQTLPAEELAAGFAEVVKTALIAGGSLWERVRGLERVDAASVAPLVFDCARTKLEVVAADERDEGRRAVLNLGHTVGHAIEAASGFGRYRHGEAVGLGLLAALRLSGAGELREEVASLLERASLPISLDPAVEADAVIEATGRDKKRTADGIGFVLLERPGEPVHGRAVDADSLRATVQELRSERQAA